MNPRTLCLLAASVALGAASTARAADTQVGDFRIGATTYPANTPFDPGFTETTRTVLNAPVSILSSFTGGSQNANGVADGDDLTLRTFSGSTVIRNISRNNPSSNGGASGPSRIGMVQWNFDLTPLEGYLSANGLSLTELDLDLLTSNSDASKALDVYLSYTNPAEGITLASIDNTSVGTGAGDDGAGTRNFFDFYNPAVGASEGGVVNGTHKVLRDGATGDLALAADLLSLYNTGVREFNLQLAGADFWSGRNIGVLEGSGVSISTEPIPEPASALLIGAGAALLLRRRRA